MPKAEKRTIFWNSTGLSYQLQEVRRCILNGMSLIIYTVYIFELLLKLFLLNASNIYHNALNIMW